MKGFIMETTQTIKKVWGVIRSPKTIAAFKLAAAILGVGVALEGLIKVVKNDSEK